MYLGYLFISISDPFNFVMYPDPLIRYVEKRIRILGSWYVEKRIRILGSDTWKNGSGSDLKSTKYQLFFLSKIYFSKKLCVLYFWCKYLCPLIKQKFTIWDQIYDIFMIGWFDFVENYPLFWLIIFLIGSVSCIRIRMAKMKLIQTDPETLLF